MANERRVSLRQFADLFCDDIEEDVQDVFNEVLKLAAESVISGSELTGSKGIPVDTGVAKNSVLAEKTGKFKARIKATGKGLNEDTQEIEDAGYIIHLEENLRGITWPGPNRSEKGGPHFFSLTHANLDKIVVEAVKRVASESDHRDWPRRPSG